MAEINPLLIVIGDKPSRVNVQRSRGDTSPQNYQLVDRTMTVIDVTGRTFRLAVDPSSEPTSDANEIYELTGEIVDAEAGKIRFPLSAGDAAATAGAYFYDIEMTYDEDDAALGVIKTIAKGRWRIKQDVTK